MRLLRVQRAAMVSVVSFSPDVVGMSRVRFERLLNVTPDTAVATTTISSHDRPWKKPNLATLSVSAHRTLSVPTLESDYANRRVE